MKKNNNKGFMLLETMVVSAFIITTLIFLYVQFSNLKKSYDESFKYDTIPELFKTKEIDKFINNNYGYADLINDVKENEDNFIELYNNSCNMSYFSKYNSYCNRLMNDMDVKTILLVSTDLSKLINKLKTNNKYSNGLYLYTKKINQSTNNNSYSLIVEFNDKKYTNLIVQEDKITVTFDANGGTVSTESKEVKPGETYGTLPTPTRAGYTFKGWNGKNIIDISKLEVFQKEVTVLENSITFDGSKTNGNILGAIRIQSSVGNAVPSGDICPAKGLNETKVYECSFTKTANFDYLALRANTNLYDPVIIFPSVVLENNKEYILSYNLDSYNKNSATATISNLQLEKGSVATEYEPYYITSNTKIVQNQDHTLTAIWEQNS